MVYMEWKIKWVHRHFSIAAERNTRVFADDTCILGAFPRYRKKKRRVRAEPVTRPELNNVLNGILATTRGLVRVINAPRSPTVPTASLKTRSRSSIFGGIFIYRGN